MRTGPRGLIAVVVLLVSAFIAGCSSNATSPPGGVSGSEVPAAAQSPRGVVVKQVGERASVASADKQPILIFFVDAITLDKECVSSYSRRAEHGHFVMVSMRLETTAAFPSDSRMIVNPYDFSIVGTDGITENGLATPAAFNCLPQNEQMPNTPYKPSSKYRGTVVLDTENPSGTLLYRPTFGGVGWGWSYPD